MAEMLAAWAMLWFAMDCASYGGSQKFSSAIHAAVEPLAQALARTEA
jgi:hypothetical protein